MEDLLNFLYEINYRLEIKTKNLAKNHESEFKAFNARKRK